MDLAIWPSGVESVGMFLDGRELPFSPVPIEDGWAVSAGEESVGLSGLDMRVWIRPDRAKAGVRTVMFLGMDVNGDRFPTGAHLLRLEFREQASDAVFPLDIKVGTYFPVTAAIFGSKSDVWMGTATRGVARVPMPEFGQLDWGTRKEFSLRDLMASSGGGLFSEVSLGESVTVLTAGEQDSVWVGTLAQGYAAIDAAGRKLLRGGNIVLPIASIRPYAPGAMLIGGFQQGATLLEYGDPAVTAEDRSSHVEHPSDPDVVDADVGPDGTVWVASTDEKKDPAGGVDGFAALRLGRSSTGGLRVEESYSFNPGNSLLSTDLLTRISVDSKGVVWVGSDVGIFVLDPAGTPFVSEDDRWSHIRPSSYFPGRKDVSDWITAIQVLSDHELLIGTGSYGGEVLDGNENRVGVLVYLDHKGTSVDSGDDVAVGYIEPDDFASSSVASIAVDEKGRVMMANGNYQPWQAGERWAFKFRPIMHSLGRMSVCFLDPGPSWASKGDDWRKCY